MASNSSGVNSVTGFMGDINLESMSLGDGTYVTPKRTIQVKPRTLSNNRIPANDTAMKDMVEGTGDFDSKAPDSPGKVSTGYKGGMAALAGAEFMLDVLNANSAYNAVTTQAQLNIMQARNQGIDALSRGREAQMAAQSEGYNAGQDSLLVAAAQGQDVNGAGAKKIQGSYEAMGIYNGMKEEVNSIREALGYELEEVNYDYQVEMAGIQKNAAFIGSALNFASKAGYYGAM